MMPAGRHRLIPLTVAVALATAGALVAVQGWSLWARLGEDAMPMAAAASDATVTPGGGGPDLAAVLAFAPFGRADAPAMPDTPPDPGPPPDLTLLGITLSDTADTSRAIIALPDGRAESFGVGQALPSGAVLASVGADHVVIRAEGGESVLRFPDNPVLAAPRAGAAAVAAGPDLVNLIPASATPTPALPALLTGIKAAMNHDPQGYIAGLGLAPDAGGYRVQPDMDPALQAAGLQSGDLVLSVNGQTPGDPARDLAILDAAAAAGTAMLQVNRDGQSLTLTVPLE